MDPTERYYTREAERAARELVKRHRAQERREAADREERLSIKQEQAGYKGPRPSERGTRGRRGMR